MDTIDCSNARTVARAFVEMNTPAVRGLALVLGHALFLASACGGNPSSPSSISDGKSGAGSNASGGTNTGGSGASISVGGSSGSGASGTSGAGGSCSGDECVIGCGNGRIDPGLDEACDDGNIASGDGCSADCRAVERDYACLVPGRACTSLVVCGDGKLMGMETCDDGNTRAMDGCSPACSLDDGWECVPAGVPCIPRCGDGVLVAGEECDGPNVGMGCSATCRLEPGFA